MTYKFNPFTCNFDEVSEEDLTGYVPYTGATTNLDLGSNNYTTTGTGTFERTFVGNGSYAGPSISFTNEPESGFYRLAQGMIGLVVDGGFIWSSTSTNFTVVTELIASQGIEPNEDNNQDNGATGKRWKNFYLAGDLKDDTDSISVSELKTAYDNRVETWGDGLTKTAQEVDVDFASIAEVDTGTETVKAITPDGLQGSKRNIRYLTFNLVGPDTDVETGTNVGGEFTIPFNGTILQDDSTKQWLMATNSTAGTTGTMVVDININGSTIMTTNKLDIETGEKSTEDATTQPDLTTTDLDIGDVITIDIDSIHSGTAAKGLTVYMAVRED